MWQFSWLSSSFQAFYSFYMIGPSQLFLAFYNFSTIGHSQCLWSCLAQRAFFQLLLHWLTFQTYLRSQSCTLKKWQKKYPTLSKDSFNLKQVNLWLSWKANFKDKESKIWPIFNLTGPKFNHLKIWPILKMMSPKFDQF